MIHPICKLVEALSVLLGVCEDFLGIVRAFKVKNVAYLVLVYLKDSNAASHFVNSLILFALSRTEQRRGIFFLHMLRRKMWVTAGMRLLCVYANRRMAVVLTNFSAMFPFVTCVKESENQPNGFVESDRKSQPSPFQKVKA